LDFITPRDQVDKAVLQGLRKTDHHIQAGTIELVFNRRETVMDHAPLRGQGHGIPRVMNITEGEAILLCEIVVDAEQFLPPMRRRRN